MARDKRTLLSWAKKEREERKAQCITVHPDSMRLSPNGYVCTSSCPSKAESEVGLRRGLGHAQLVLSDETSSPNVHSSNSFPSPGHTLQARLTRIP